MAIDAIFKYLRPLTAVPAEVPCQRVGRRTKSKTSGGGGSSLSVACASVDVDSLLADTLSASPMIRDFQQTTVASIGLLAQANTICCGDLANCVAVPPRPSPC